MEQLHVTAGGNVPAEVGFHFLLLQGTESVPVVVVQIQAALDGSHEVVGIVALEGEAQAALAVFVAGWLFSALAIALCNKPKAIFATLFFEKVSSATAFSAANPRIDSATKLSLRGLVRIERQTAIA